MMQRLSIVLVCQPSRDRDIHVSEYDSDSPVDGVDVQDEVTASILMRTSH